MSDDTKSGMPTGGPPSGFLPPLPGASADAPTGLGGMTTAEVLAQRWGPRGDATVGLNVRSSSQAKFPAQVHDVKGAIRYLRASAPQYDLDVDRFAAMGTSSGAWTTLMAGTTAGVPELERIREPFVRRNEAGIRRLQERGLADPQLDAAMAATMLGSMIENFSMLWFVHGVEYDEDLAGETLTRLWAQAIGLSVPTQADSEGVPAP